MSGHTTLNFCHNFVRLISHTLLSELLFVMFCKRQLHIIIERANTFFGSTTLLDHLPLHLMIVDFDQQTFSGRNTRHKQYQSISNFYILLCHFICYLKKRSKLSFLQTRARLQAVDREGSDCGAKQSGEELVQRDPQMVGWQDRTLGH